jgi:RsiW-degrading membrane proteinase PrsW (M82 family)
MLLPVLLHAAWDAPSFSIFTILKLLLLLVLYAVTVTAFLLAVRWGRRSDAALLSLPSTGVESTAQRLD